MFCVSFVCCILFVWCGVYGFCPCRDVTVHNSFIQKDTLMWFYILLGSSFWAGYIELRKVASLSVSHTTSLLSVSALTVVALGLLLFHSVWLRVVYPPELSPLSPLPSTVNKQPEPIPRRANVVSRKQPQLTSPTFQPPLPPLEAGVPVQPEHQPQVLSLGTEAEQPGLSGGGVVGGLSGGVQVATVKPQVVTQLSAEESR